MASIGFEKIEIGVITDEGKVEERFVIDADEGGAISTEVSGLGAAAQKVYASNGVFHVSQKGTGEVTATVAIADIPEDVLNAILGYEPDPLTGLIKIGSNTEPPYCSVLFTSQDKEGKDIHLGLTKGKFVMESVAFNTTEAETNLNTDSITFTAAANSDGITIVKSRETQEGYTLEALTSYLFPTV